ncbi:glycosyltransferase family 4 protein [Microvirga guangxiensis]|uniref:Glycosyltransferase involved in cell wall bisynthesis n=1 Tax=Microvirga guangxiensis TaxID=549386 RepID=A0A1G5I6S5_9HYPH|nr:glycosyltransferase family 4 protein [Microvirga guangxiensis]SCY71674.1 Glycosyltransferase involved in cell wall bisynthesis [Microvirga guangxiensis]
MKILIVETDDCGGLLHFTFQFASSLQQAGADVTMLANHNHELADIEQPFRVDASLRFWSRVSPPDKRSKRRFLRKIIRAGITVREWIHIVRIIHREKPDYTIFGLLRNPIEAAAISYLRWRGYRLIDVCHEFILREKKGRVSNFINAKLMKFLYTRFSSIIFLSEKVILDFKCSVVSDVNAHWIPHGPEALFDVDEREQEVLARRYGLRKDEPIVLFFGGLRPSKGLDILVKAFSLIPPGKAKLLIVGYPSQEFDLVELQTQIDHLDRTRDIILDPRYVPMNEVGSLVALSSLVVFPYKSATASGALSLAHSQGRATIASDVGGLSEAIQHGINGWLVPPNDIEALGDAMVHLLQDHHFRTALGDAARERMEIENNWKVIGERVVRILEWDATERRSHKECVVTMP